MKYILKLFVAWLLCHGVCFADLPPGTVTLHVASAGDAMAADGSMEAPFVGLGQGLSAATPLLQGGTPVRLLFAPGIYREGGVEWVGHDFGSTAQQTPLILEGAEMDGVVFSGAVSWSGGWTEGSPGHWTRVWPYAWGIGPDPWADWDYHLPLEMRRREMLVMDGERVLPVFATEDLTEDRFFVDEDAGVIHYRGPDPNVREVEVPVERFLISMRGKSNLTVRRIVVRHYSHYIDEAAAARFWGFGENHIPTSVNILVEDSRFDDNSAQGLSVGLYDGGTVRRVRLHGNGYLNVSFPTNHNLLLEDIETTGANWRGYPHGQLSWSAGGMKLTRAHGLTLRRLVAAENLTNGIWFDVYVGANQVEELHAFGQANYGLYFELSDGPLVLDGGNFGNNATAMVLAETSDMEVRHVEAVSNQIGVILRENGRGYPLKRLVFTDNHFATHRQGDLFFSRAHNVSDADMEGLAPGFEIQRNRYTHAFPQQAFRIPGLTSLAGWQNFLQEYPAITGKDLDAAASPLDATGRVNGPVVWEIWDGLPAATLGALRDLPAFQAQEADLLERRWLTEDVWGREGAYGQRGSARLRAPVTGTYHFRLSADAEAELWMGLDGALSALQHVISVTTPLARRSETGPVFSVNLNAGQVVPFQLLHAGRGGSEGAGHVSLLWSRPDRVAYQPISAVHLLQPRVRVEAVVGTTVVGGEVPAVLRIHRDPPLAHPLEVRYAWSGVPDLDLGLEMPVRIPAGQSFVDLPVLAAEGDVSGHQTLTVHLLDGALAKVAPGEGLAMVRLLDPLFSPVPVLAEDFQALSDGSPVNAGNTAFTHARIDGGVSLTATADLDDEFGEGPENVYARFVDNDNNDLLQLGYDYGEGLDPVATLAFDVVDRSLTESGNYFSIRMSTAANAHETYNVMLTLRRENGQRNLSTAGTQAQQFALPDESLLRMRIIANNSQETLYHYHGTQSLAPGKVDVWVNGVLLGDNLNYTVFIGAQGHDGLAFRSLAFQTFASTVNVDVGLDNVHLYAGAVMAESLAVFPDLVLAQTAPGTLRATWEGFPDADRYGLWFRRAGGGAVGGMWILADEEIPGSAWEMSLPGLAPGESYEVMLRAYAGEVLLGELQQAATLDLEPPPFSADAAYPHRVVLEAEHFHSQSDNGSGIHWTPVTSPPGFSGASAMKGGPNDPDDFLLWNENVPTTAPVLTYRVNFPVAGNYYVLVRARSPAQYRTNADSLHVGINQTLPESATNIDRTAGDDPQPIPNTGWNWVGVRQAAGQARAYITVPEPGVHTLHIWPREDGVMVDQVLLSQDIHWIPEDAQVQSQGGPVQEGLAGWRQQIFGTYQSYGDAADDADPDGDGVSNFFEYAFGTDPLDAASRPATRITADAGHAVLRYTRRPPPHGLHYTVWVTTDLREPWQLYPSEQLTEQVEAGEARDTVWVPVPLEAQDRVRFYRIGVE